MNEGLQFRTSAFGGFNKQDVMAYLEKSAREHSGKIAELQKELAELRQARTEAEDAGETMKSRLAVLEAENQRLAADLAQREAALAQALERGEAQAAELTVLKEEAETLRPAAASYESIKSRTASIELEAHGRAQAIEQEGRVRAKKAQEQVLDWFDKMQAAYLRLRTDIDAPLHHAAREMERAGQSLWIWIPLWAGTIRHWPSFVRRRSIWSRRPPSRCRWRGSRGKKRAKAGQKP